jgi:NADH:ubiquinone oxidoreductase subunit 5 (subunit L)/multisubunit Na+/H+ antiporter MnhA subunit
MMTHLLYGAVAFLIGGAIVAAIGQDLMKEHGRSRTLPAVCVAAVLFGLILAWAVNVYIDYVNASAAH